MPTIHLLRAIDERLPHETSLAFLLCALFFHRMTKNIFFVYTCVVRHKGVQLLRKWAASYGTDDRLRAFADASRELTDKVAS
jgi:hypothetical protein